MLESENHSALCCCIQVKASKASSSSKIGSSIFFFYSAHECGKFLLTLKKIVAVLKNSSDA